MNATDALENPVKDRNEPIDRETLEFEGLMINQLLNTTGQHTQFQMACNCVKHYWCFFFSSRISKRSEKFP